MWGNIEVGGIGGGELKHCKVLLNCVHQPSLTSASYVQNLMPSPCQVAFTIILMIWMPNRRRSSSGFSGVGSGGHHPPISPRVSVLTHLVRAAMALRKIMAQRESDFIRRMKKVLKISVVDIAPAVDRVKPTL